MPNADDLAHLDATAQAELVRTKQVKPLELVEAAIERIERLNPRLNAVVTPLYDEARKIAAAKLPNGPFKGVPFLLKDLGAANAGVRQTLGSVFARDYVPDHDSELVVRHKRAGLVILGKTNTPEFGILPTTEPRLFGPARNPWDTNRTTGGSSGGSAAAVASGMVPIAHANDGGGSIRIPASCCGLFGLKPTRARNPLGPDLGDMISGLAVEHAVTRSVRDSAALLDATCGPDIGDPYWAPPPKRRFLKEVGADPGTLRIAFTATAQTGVSVHPDCVAAVQDAAKLCADLGHEVTEAAPEANGELALQCFTAVFAGGCAWTFDGLAYLTGKTPTADEVEPLTWAIYQMGRGQSASEYLLAITMLQRMSRDIARFFTEYDIVITPTLAEPPVPLGTFDSPPDNPLQGLLRAGEFVPFTPVCNFTGQPAMSVPLFWNAEGLPIGVHFIGRFGDEATLFRLAAQLEQARPWANRRPPVSA
ncbi:MAG: amidase [Candidatus Abyssobacteria bacterium SURF_17]|uniref:Amidase n=1 Tax=Candidatus Abyssobacteria bacterium SURF_17 TaxID=2093361 RepID=A0A419ET33_9BACT|nr:MAG: amidase [Candidatus Abyssubacteria bacterium SURF_17]